MFRAGDEGTLRLGMVLVCRDCAQRLVSSASGGHTECHCGVCGRKVAATEPVYRACRWECADKQGFLDRLRAASKSGQAGNMLDALSA